MGRKTHVNAEPSCRGDCEEDMSALAKRAHKRLDLLADATGRLAKAERLVKKWREQASKTADYGCYAALTNRHAEELERLLKP